MKKLMFIVAAALLAVGCNSTKSYVVEGQVDGFNGEVAIMDMSGQEVLGSTTATDGKFTITVESATPLFATLAFDGTTYIPVFLDGSPITVSGSSENLAYVTAAGTVSNEVFAEFSKKQMEMMAPLLETEGDVAEEDVMSIFFELRQMMDKSYEANKYTLWGAYIFASSKYREYSGEELMEILAGYDEDIMQMEEMKSIKEYAENLLKTGVGKSYIDLTLPDVEGQEVSLSEVVENNKVVLLDFWASWCRPCMGELPYLLEAYEKYHAMGFEIYGVSLDEDAEAWKECIAKQNMTWVNVSDVSGWNTPAAKEYSVNSIPANFLIDSEGVIIAKNLRGEEVAEKLAEIFE